MSKKEEQPVEEIQPVSSKISSAILLLEEKLCREYDLSLEELRASTITIKNGEVTVKGQK